jgi:hypothetical protein
MLMNIIKIWSKIKKNKAGQMLDKLIKLKQTITDTSS